MPSNGGFPLGPMPWRQLAAAVAPPGDRQAMLDDLSEEYGERLRANARMARRWYRQQAEQN